MASSTCVQGGRAGRRATAATASMRLDRRGPVAVVQVGHVARLVDALAHERLGVLGDKLGVEAASRCHPAAKLLDLGVLGGGGGLGLVQRLLGLGLILLDLSEPARREGPREAERQGAGGPPGLRDLICRGALIICGGALILLIGGGGVGAARLRRERQALHRGGGGLDALREGGRLKRHVFEVLPEGRLGLILLCDLLLSRDLSHDLLLSRDLRHDLLALVLIMALAGAHVLRGRCIVRGRLALAGDLRGGRS
eukprot:scaffold16112_cov63-Phaeocystis_antarctica.AAC.2